MADEKPKEPGTGGADGAAGGADTTPKKPDERSETRFQDLTQKLKDKDEQHAKDLADRDARLASLEFESNFKDIVQTYPYAPEFKDKIREKVQAGVPLKDATVLILNENQKLIPRSDVERQSAGAGALGGSGSFIPPAGQKRPEDMTTEELRAALVVEEQKGTFSVKPD